MGAAAAFETGQALADLGIAGMRLLLEECRRGHDPAIDAVAALRHLLVDIGLLQRMRMLARSQSFENNSSPRWVGGCLRAISKTF